MKKRIAAFLLAAAVLMLAACGSKAEAGSSAADAEQAQETQITGVNTQEIYPSTESAYPGVYWQAWSEEIGGTVIEMNSYIVLNEDGTGCWIAQDVGTLTWDEHRLMLTVGAAYDIALTQEDGTVNLLVYEFRDNNGEWMPTVFEKIDKLPAEMEIMLGES